MSIRYLTLFSILVFLTGCATSTQPSAYSNLQIKIAQMERKLEERDQTITELESQVKQLTMAIDEYEDQAGEYKKYPVEEYVPSAASKTSKTTGSSQASKDDDTRIVRVDVSEKTVQTALKNAGYYEGNIDGKIGQKTKQAISSFQKDHGLKADGIIGKQTWLELKKFLD